MVVANVEDFALTAQVECCTQGAFNRVINIGKASGL